MAGHNFNFSVTVPQLPAGVDQAALGASSSAKFVDADRNKIVKLAGNNNYVLANDGDDIEGVVISIEPHTVNNGFSFGSVMVRFKHLEAQVSGSALSVGNTVVAAAQSALGTAQAYPLVKAGSGSLFKWRVKSLLAGTGQAGQVVLLEPLTR